MLIAWAYNELGENITPATQSFDLRFARPTGASSVVDFKIGIEDMRCASWGAKSPLTDITLAGVTRGYNSTPAARHYTGDTVWIKNQVDKLNTDELGLIPSLVSSLFTGGDIHTIISDGLGGYYIGGDFTTVNASATYGGLAHVNSYGVVDTNFKPLLSGGSALCRALYILPDGNILVGGDFATLAGNGCKSLGIIDKNGLFVANKTQAVSNDPNIYVFETDDTHIYIGGRYLTDLGASVLRFKISELLKNSSVRDDYDLYLSGGDVRDLCLHNNSLYMVGSFTGMLVINDPGPASIVRNGAAAAKAKIDIDSSNFNAEMTQAVLPWDPNANGDVNTIVKHGDYFYIAGAFTNVGGTGTTRLARVDISGALDQAWTPDAIDATVYDLELVDNSLDGSPYIAVGGVFTTPQIGLMLVDIGTADDFWNPQPDAEVRKILVENGRVLIGGDFANIDATARASFAILSDNTVASEIGVYKLEWIEPGNTRDPIHGVRIEVFYGSTDPVNSIHDQLITAPVQSSSGYSYTTSQFILTRPSDSYIVRVTVGKDSGTTIHYTTLESGTVESVVVVPDGVEEGDQYNKSDTFAAPAVSKVGNAYEVTPVQQAVTPTSTDPTHYFRVWLIVDPGGGLILDYQVSFGFVVDIVNIANTAYYSERIAYQTDGATNLTVTARGVFASTLVSTGPHAVAASAASSVVDADQIQVEYEFTNGAWGGRVISDWQDIPSGGVFDYINIGPSTHEFSFRYRYRTFRRDGIEDQSGRPVMVSVWSSWSALLGSGGPLI